MDVCTFQYPHLIFLTPNFFIFCISRYCLKIRMYCCSNSICGVFKESSKQLDEIKNQIEKKYFWLTDYNDFYLFDPKAKMWAFLMLWLKSQQWKVNGLILIEHFSTGALKALYMTWLTHTLKCFLWNTGTLVDASDQLGVRYLAQGYFGVQSGGVRNQSTYLPTGKWPSQKVWGTAATAILS